jgi:hypothetical protein
MMLQRRRHETMHPGGHKGHIRQLDQPAIPPDAMSDALRYGFAQAAGLMAAECGAHSTAIGLN